MRPASPAAAVCLAAALAGGCASPQMKGTPFFSGEYGVRRGPASDRVNLWPLLYYRDPALSVLWPLIESTDDHFAVRPAFSMYGLEKEGGRVVNVLWPLARFDQSGRSSRVFPVFWGDDHRAVFPLYWHFGEPFGPAGGYDGLLPLWSIRRDGRGGHSTHALWPLFHVKRWGDERGWRAGPLAGSYRDADSLYQFALWPLGHRWRDAGGASGHAFVPLYCASANRERNLFLSPLYFRSAAADGERAWRLLLPLFFHWRDGADSLFVSPAWMQGSRGGDAGWRLLPPLYFASRGETGRSLFTPLYARGSDAGGGERWHAVLPLYYRGVSERERTTALVTPLGGFRRGPDGRRWLLYPLLTGGRRDGNGGDLWVLGPIFHAGWDAESARHHLFPFYWWDGRRDALLSPLAARWKNGDGGSSTLVPPLLSLYRGAGAARDLWYLGGLGRASWGASTGPDYLFPFYYAAGDNDDTLLSPLYARWSDGVTTWRALPVLLSGWGRTDGTDDLRLLLGLFRQTWGGGGAEGHLLPLYYYRGGATCFTPLFGWQREGDRRFFYPLTPLAGVYAGDDRGGWLFPLFSHRRAANGWTRGTVLWGPHWRRGERSESSLFPFYRYTNNGDIDSALPAGARHASFGRRIAAFPALWYRNERFVNPRVGPRDQAAAAPALRDERVLSHGFFPLWSYRRRACADEGSRETDARILLALWDYRRREPPRVPHPGDPGDGGDQVRARVLWRLWHYERAGDEVSVDVFPAVTYDRRGDRFRKVSFLWRAFRYERGERGTDLDLLFIPILRGRGRLHGASAGGSGRES